MVSPGALAVLAAAYYAVLAVLALFGLHRLVLVVLWWRCRRRGVPRVAPPASWPTVLVQLPIYNERFVAARLVRAVAALDYPRDRLEVQVLDDSTDDTALLLHAEVAHARRRGLPISHLRRTHRAGYKAGALSAGLLRSEAELVAIFDADFVPPSDFLRRVVPYFAAPLEPPVAMVQARWDYANRDHSFLTAAQAMLLDGHFLVEQTARSRSGRWFNFNGTAGVLRRSAILDAGGWHHDTLTEDLDLSYRAQLGGARFLFLDDLPVPSELPADIHALKTQQQRWAKGTAQTLRKLLPAVVRSGAPPPVVLEAAVHLLGCLSYPLLVLLSLLVLPAAYAGRTHGITRALALDLPLLALATGAVAAFYLLAARLAGTGAARAIAGLPAMLAVGVGLAPSNAGAVLGGLWRSGGEFERTPKFTAAEDRGGGRRPPDDFPPRYTPRTSRAVWVEAALALHSALGAALAVRLALWWALPFLLLFLGGYVLVAWLSLAHRPAPNAPRPEGRASRPAGAPSGQPPRRHLAAPARARARSGAE